MKIQNMELFKVPPRWLFLKITTDDGLVGWGEPILEGRANTVRTAVEEMSGDQIGKGPFPYRGSMAGALSRRILQRRSDPYKRSFRY